MALGFLFFSIQFMMVKEWIEVAIVIDKVSQNVSSKSFADLPHFYTNLRSYPPSMKALRSHLFLLPITCCWAGKASYKQQTEQEYTWLNYTS